MEIRTEPRTAIRVICHDSAMRNSAKTMIEHKLMMIRTKLVCAPAISHDSVLRISNNSSLIALSNEIILDVEILLMKSVSNAFTYPIA